MTRRSASARESPAAPGATDRVVSPISRRNPVERRNAGRTPAVGRLDEADARTHRNGTNAAVREWAFAHSAAGAVDRAQAIDHGGPARARRGQRIPQRDRGRAAGADQQSAQAVGLDRRSGRRAPWSCAPGRTTGRSTVLKRRVGAVDRGNVARRLGVGATSISPKRRGLRVEPVDRRLEQQAKTGRQRAPRSEDRRQTADPARRDRIERRIRNDADVAGRRLHDRNGRVAQIAALFAGERRVAAERIGSRRRNTGRRPSTANRRASSGSTRRPCAKNGTKRVDAVANVAVRDQRRLGLRQIVGQQSKILKRPRRRRGARARASSDVPSL